jgi:ABC-type sugar transport system substrate-binding protein
MKKGATLSRTGALHVVLLTLSVFLVSSSAEARKWRWRHFYGVYDYGYVVPFGDDGWRDRVSEGVETARARTGGGFGAIIDRLIRGCVQQAADLQNLPFDEIARIVAPKAVLIVRLEAVRCPRSCWSKTTR